MTSKWMRVVLLTLLTTALLAGCTRDRSTPEPEATQPAAAEPVVEPAITRDAVPTAGPTPAPTAVSTQTPEPKTIPYTVQPNDTVSTVAEKFGISAQQLRELNLLANDNLQVGQVLRVPNTPGVTSEGLPTPTPEPFTYTVQEGDTLFSIALKFEVSPNEIVAANTLTDPNNVFVGQELLIPGYQPTSPASSGGGTTTNPGAPAIHIVQPGEVLSVIAEKYGITLDELVAANRIADPNLVTPGTELVIPGLTAAALEAANQIIHIVAPGEGLYSIAARYGVSADAIIEANRITNPDLIRVGDRLIIPQ
ncbi:MAG: LysM peptidoglycan-binding domain-containing protein [Caldilineaceae bacterium]|nr:LysM peptidoglycan-binding domain-containing protein [Caldilineaceae bacterium]HRJ42213.1 LysM peptidoglycan-binding domain-containing protein [Caldilineaceae bacterium]